MSYANGYLVGMYLQHTERGNKIIWDLCHGRHPLSLSPTLVPHFLHYNIPLFAESHAMWFQSQWWQHYIVRFIKVWIWNFPF